MSIRSTRFCVIAIAVAAIVALPVTRAVAQNAEMGEKLQDIKQASAAYKAALARYTWQEQRTISLRGQVKRTSVYQVSMGPDGQQQKTELSSTPPAGAGASQGGGGGFKQRIVARKTEEFKEYGEQIAALSKQYTQLDPQALQQAYQQGNISLQMGGASGMTSLVIKNYLKPGDSMTLGFNSQAKAIESIKVASYLTDPGDAVTVAVDFAKLPSGINHVANVLVNGVSKQLTVAMQNSNYQPKAM